jgi:sortase A
MSPHQAWRWLMFAALLLAAGLGLSGVWIHAKAALAQLLLQRAWIGSDHGRRMQRPWPWADIAPIAQLSVPRLGQELIVLDGDHGQALAFGPGWMRASAPPGTPGLSIISAHRDTQFRFLQALHPGDLMHLDGPGGGSDYRVEGSRVIDSRHVRVPAADSMDGLWLVTCYPFGAIVPGGPLRYVVQARRLNPAPADNRPHGNQTGSVRSVVLIGGGPLAVERAGTTADPPSAVGVSAAPIHGVPSHVNR